MSCSRECVRLLPMMLPYWVYRRLGERWSRRPRCSLHPPGRLQAGPCSVIPVMRRQEGPSV